MSRRHSFVVAAVLLPALLAAAARAGSYRLPVEQPIALPAGPDVELVEAHCAACHSLDYVRTQPRGKGAQFWRDSVAKMVNVYGAPLAPDEARRAADYLARTFG